jgi:hypothetical protein
MGFINPDPSRADVLQILENSHNQICPSCREKNAGLDCINRNFPRRDLRSVAIAGSQMEQRNLEAQRCVLPVNNPLSDWSAARVLSSIAEPERDHSEGGALPSLGLAGRGGFGHGESCRQGLAGQPDEDPPGG